MSRPTDKQLEEVFARLTHARAEAEALIRDHGEGELIHLEILVNAILTELADAYHRVELAGREARNRIGEELLRRALGEG